MTHPFDEETNERPILFSGEMVRAILAGRKTQTRRVLKPQPGLHLGYMMGREQRYAIQVGEDYPDDASDRVQCPYGGPGDRLWARETFSSILVGSRCDAEAWVYRADGEDKAQVWRPSIYMPRMASRITLRVKNVRVERVQDISGDDVAAEGCRFVWGNRQTLGSDEEGARRLLFSQLWDGINAKRGYSWESNPWVWVVEFARECAVKGEKG